MKKLFYPAIFEKEDTGYSIFFPNIPGQHSGLRREEVFPVMELHMLIIFMVQSLVQGV